VWAVNWELVWFRLPDRQGNGGQYGKVLLLNPLRGTKAEQQSLFAQADTAERFLEAFRELKRGRR